MKNGIIKFPNGINIIGFYGEQIVPLYIDKQKIFIYDYGTFNLTQLEKKGLKYEIEDTVKLYRGGIKSFSFDDGSVVMTLDKSEEQKYKKIQLKLRQAKKIIKQNQITDTQRVELLNTLFNKLKGYGEYENSVMIRGVIFTYIMSNDENNI